jgi:hypothetical protein
MRSSLRPHPTSPELRTVAVREGPFSMDKSHLKLVAPAEVNRIVAPTRRPNAELRTREHLTPGEVEAAKANRHGHRDATMILLAFRDGLRAAELIALEWSQVDFAAAVLHVRRVRARPPRTRCVATKCAPCASYSAIADHVRPLAPPVAGLFPFTLPRPRGVFLCMALCVYRSAKKSVCTNWTSGMLTLATIANIANNTTQSRPKLIASDGSSFACRFRSLDTTTPPWMFARLLPSWLKRA